MSQVSQEANCRIIKINKKWEKYENDKKRWPGLIEIEFTAPFVVSASHAWCYKQLE